MSVKCAVIGNLSGCGAREDAIACFLAQSPRVDEVLFIPGNGSLRPKYRRISVPAEIHDQQSYIQWLQKLAATEKINLSVIGPESLLIDGVVDHWPRHLKIWGTNGRTARLEGSKAFAVQLMTELGIAIPFSKIFTDLREAIDWLATQPKNRGWVVKDDGQAAGKGVEITSNRRQTADVITRKMQKNRCIVVQEILVGREVSAIFLVGYGGLIVPLTPAQDYKRAFDPECETENPMTGGMGCVSPVNYINAATMDFIREKMVRPIVMATNFTGTFYAGIMLTKDGPKMLEINVRFGAPETEVQLTRMQDDLFVWLTSLLEGGLPYDRPEISWNNQAAVGVVMTDSCYPAPVPKWHNSLEIFGIKEAEAMENVFVYQGGTGSFNDQPNRILTQGGGRRLTVVALADNQIKAAERAYEAVKKIHWSHCRYREKIGIAEQ